MRRRRGRNKRLLVTASATLAAYVAAAGLGAGPASAGTWDDLAWMYQPSEVVQIHLTLNDEQKAALNTNDELRDWVGDVGFWMQGSGGKSFASAETPRRSEAKLKGHTSFRFLDQKASFNLKLPKDSRPDGLKRITLNNMVQDPSYLRETTAYEIFRAAGLPAARPGYAQLWVTDEYYGLYLNLEKYNDQSLEHWFSSLGHLFESTSRSDILRTGDLLNEDFEVDEGDEEDLSDLEALTAAARTGEWGQIAAHLASPESVISYLAAEWYVGQWDGYAWNQNNYYLHSDANGLFTLLPSGPDQAFRTNVPRGDFNLSFPLSSALETWNTPRGAGALIEACFADPACSDQFIHELEDVKQAAVGLDEPTKVTARAAALSPLIASDPRKEHNLGSTALAQKGIVDHLQARNDAVEQLLLTHPLTMHTPAITGAPEAVTTAKDATFEFGAGLDESQGVTGFECSLDEADFTACTPPASYQDLPVGDHRFEVRAVNDGDTPSPATARTWTVADLPKHALTINETGDGSGSVSADPAGPQYDEGTEVTLTATPDAGSTFTGWTGCDSVSTAGDCIVTMDQARTVTAAFALVKQPGIVGWVKAPEKRKVKRGEKVVVEVRVKNAGDEPLATQLDAEASDDRVKVKGAYAVSAGPGQVDVVRARIRATRKARGTARITFEADGEKAVTRVVVKKR
jgi:hypothetical protein